MDKYRKWGLWLRIALPFFLFVVAGSFLLSAWLYASASRESRDQFAMLARNNADFIRTSRLAATERMAVELGRILELRVFFRESDGRIVPGLSGELANLEKEIARLDPPAGVVRLGASHEAAESPIDAARSLVLIRPVHASTFLFRPLTLIILVAFWLLSLVLAWALTRGLVNPLRVLAKRLPGIESDRVPALPGIERNDEIGLLAEGLQLMGRAVQARDSDIRTLAYTDRLTGLMNRTAFADALATSLKADARSHAVALIDIRRFRRINECLGYSVGDDVLRQIGARLTAPPALGRSVARVAGDYFAVHAPLDPSDSLAAFGTRLLARLSDPVTVSSQSIDVSTAVGLAVAPAHSTDADDLMRCADLALERARRENATLQVYEPGLRAATRDQLSLLGELERAIAQDELVLAFQPKLSLADCAVRGAEALIRWQHPTRGLLAPFAFIPFAEQTGFIRHITRWAIASGTRTAARWARAGAPVPLSINISADDLADPTLPDIVREALDDSGLAPDLLTLELTESGFIADPERALQRLEALRIIGVGLSLDDFGTGYSSLSYLARMPVDELKIDRSFVTGIAEREEVAAIVRAAAEMAHCLGLTVVAEGIEDVDTAIRLSALGCDLGQGYLYAKPMLEADFLRWRAQRVPMPSQTSIVRSLASAQRRA